ncbi:hypothetical protein ACFWG0_36380 [Streptomyces yangpuensis]|uniref:hypothetical protein n=1 Tax=Streptomyces yangpuensis TaxID=1648182 RepID=UPI0036578D53
MLIAPAYRAKTVDYDQTVTARTYTALEADALIAAALWDEDQVIPDGDRSGRMTIIRTITGHRSAGDTERRTLRRTTRLEPVRPPRRLTARQYEDLALVLARDARGGGKLEGGRIAAGIASIPPSATTRLVEHGWLAVDPDGAVTVSYAGRVAMTLHEHQAGTGYIGTDKWVVDAFGVGGWEIGSGLFVARCSCGYRSPSRFDDRAMAQGASRGHRMKHLRAAFDLTG